METLITTNQSAVDELLDEGFSPRPRDTARTSWKVIPNAYDDVCIGCLSEVPKGK